MRTAVSWKLVRDLLEAQKITIEQLRRDDDGEIVVAGRDVATVTTIIGIEHEDG